MKVWVAAGNVSVIATDSTGRLVVVPIRTSDIEGDETPQFLLELANRVDKARRLAEEMLKP